jgi:hypothetical protein
VLVCITLGATSLLRTAFISYAHFHSLFTIQTILKLVKQYIFFHRFTQKQSFKIRSKIKFFSNLSIVLVSDLCYIFLIIDENNGWLKNKISNRSRSYRTIILSIVKFELAYKAQIYLAHTLMSTMYQTINCALFPQCKTIIRLVIL